METPATKRCPKCGETKPRTSEFWHLNASRGDGLRHWCKSCSTAYANSADQKVKRSRRQSAKKQYGEYIFRTLHLTDRDY